MSVLTNNRSTAPFMLMFQPLAVCFELICVARFKEDLYRNHEHVY